MASDAGPWPDQDQAPAFGGHAWLEAVSAGFLPLEVQPWRPREFWGRISTRELGPARVALVSSQAHTVRRTAPLAARSEHNYLKALWMVEGRCQVEQGAHQSLLEAGQWAVYETGRPYSIQFADDARFAVALLPLELCADWCSLGQHLCAQALGPDPASRGAFHTLISAFEHALGASAAGFDALGRATALLVAESLRIHGAPQLAPDRHARRLQDAHRLVERHLSDPDFGPQALAEGLHLSLRSVYALFRTQGTSPVAFIQHIRLEHCRRALTNPALATRSITEIALAHGFADSAHFSRLFKARYGVTPRGWRGDACRGLGD
ncbi:helix-turn-helix domain-containing protein [Zoogloea sp.]|uniref:helix-turn-helix domain-containing protein n=1 Tax=Zoogloea sp. TaxID=49181 RepID=UPI0035B30AC4